MNKKKLAGRPKLPDNKKRSIYICINCNAEELRMIEKKEKQYKLGRSSLIRLALEKI